MAGIFRTFDKGQRGLTLVELLVVIIGLAILIIVAGPRVSDLLGNDRTISLANAEALNVKTAAINYQVNTGKYPADSDILWDGQAAPQVYLGGPLRGYYTFDIGTGRISSATTDTIGHLPGNPWTGVRWDTMTDSWVKR